MKSVLLPFIVCAVLVAADQVQASAPLVNSETVFQEKAGIVAVEAEHFFKQTATDKRAFYLTTARDAPARLATVDMSLYVRSLRCARTPTEWIARGRQIPTCSSHRVSSLRG